jgi:spore germination cell wall hydrolase CwlJ-like protein
MQILTKITATIVALAMMTLPVMADSQSRQQPVTAAPVPCQATSSDRRCMLCAVYHEARGETSDGQIAVALVVLNRVQSPRYPDTVCEVVWQKGWSKRSQRYIAQLSWTLDGKSDKMKDAVALNAADLAIRIAKILFDKGHARLTMGIGKDVLWYHADYVTPRWAKRLSRKKQIGSHIFYAQHMPL